MDDGCVGEERCGAAQAGEDCKGVEEIGGADDS